MPPAEKTKTFSITTKFILCFFFIAVLSLATATYVSYNSSRKALTEEVTRSLLVIADTKISQIESYLNAKRDALEALSRGSDIPDILQKFSAAYSNNGVESAEYSILLAEYGPFLSYTQRSLGYNNIMLVSPDGQIVFSGNAIETRSLYEIAIYDKGSKLAKTFIAAKESSQVQMSDFQYNPEQDKAVVFLAAPVVSGREFLGGIVAQMDNKELRKFALDYKGLGETGETQVAFLDKDKVVFITPLRFDPKSTLRKSIYMGSRNGRAIQAALLGNSGSGPSIDYRGKEVLAIWRYLPSYRLGVTVKTDIEEVSASADRLRNTLLKLGLSLLALVIITAILMGHSVASPIKELTAVSSVITGGDLSARAKITTHDEIGELADSFNHMTTSLIDAKAGVEREKEKLAEQKKLLEKANQELDSFVYTVSHDLRAPLRGISAFARFLEEDYLSKLDAEGQENVHEIKKGAERMNQLIEDLLALSRISRIQNPYEEVEIRELIDAVLERINFDIKEKKVEIIIAEKMPRICCDRVKISELFLNLVNNAIKFSSKNNKENPRVEIGYSEAGLFHQFSVRDNGIGIAPEHHQQVFGIFKRLHTSEEYQGTGVGLSIVQRVVADHGGKIWIESELGKGATFYFTISKLLLENPKAAAKQEG